MSTVKGEPYSILIIPSLEKRLLQSQKTGYLSSSLLISLTDFEINISFNEEQQWNAFWLIFVTKGGIITFWREEQSIKIPRDISVIYWGRIISWSLVHPSKQFSPIFVMESERWIWVSLVHLSKQWEPIVLMELENWRLERE